MKPFKFMLRVWITISSVVAFLTAWIILGHSPKPVSAESSSGAAAVVLPTLEPIPAFGTTTNTESRSFSFFSQPQVSRRQQPRFVTGGS